MSCAGETIDHRPKIELISYSVDGATINGTLLDVHIAPEVIFVFSAQVDPSAFASALRIVGGGSPVDYSLTFSNAASKVAATMSLAYNTAYTITIDTTPIGTRGERLAEPLIFDFVTAADDLIRSMQPCINVGDCLRSVQLQGDLGSGKFEFYSNYPVYEQKAYWENLTQAIFVVHGASHNADDYFAYVTNALRQSDLSESTVLIAPYFKNSGTENPSDFYWANVRYRDGNLSSNPNKISSFKVIDLLISQLANKERFPALKKIVITGQSSGGLFTHVYAPANHAEATYTDIAFHYLVGESQYFYYPDGQRISEVTNSLYTPDDCLTHEFWPMGYKAIPTYLSGIPKPVFNERFVNRSIYYLLGGGNEIDGSLNTTDCSATLLGDTRYRRGVNMMRYMDLVYPDQHNHLGVVVPDVTHNGMQIYGSQEFQDLLKQLFQ